MLPKVSLLRGKSTKIFLVPWIVMIYKARLYFSFGPLDFYYPSFPVSLQPLPLRRITKRISLFLHSQVGHFRLAT